MNTDAINGALRRLWIPFFTPVPKALKKVEAEFRKGARIVQVMGYPKKVFCVHQPEDNAALLRNREVGEIKYPGLLPRVKYAMRSGGYIHEGGPQWRERRRQVQEAFRSSQLKRYVELVPAKTQQAIARWTQVNSPTTTLDIAEEMRLLITAINLKLFFSDDAQGERLQRITDWTHFIEYRFVGVVPLWIPTPTTVRFLRYLRALREEFESIAKSRISVSSDKRDLLSVLIAAQPAEANATANVDAIVDEAFSVFFGASVMAVSLTWALHQLAQDSQLQCEFRAQVKDWLSKNADNPASLAASADCDALVKETLRLFPASWGYPRHCRSGMNLADVQIPPGSIVIPMIEYAHQDPAIWQDSERFCPARFASDQGNSNVSGFAHLPFGLGTRMCLGANLAPMVLKTVLGMVVNSFEINLASNTSAQIEPSYGFEIQPPGPVNLILRYIG